MTTLPRLRQFTPPGEPWVWLTSMGLAIGIMMVVGLLGIVFWNGLGVFWPSKVVHIELATPIDGRSIMIGQIAESRSRRPVGATTAIGEYLVFRGNKQYAGSPFIFVQHGNVRGQSPVANAMVVERREHGTLIGLPVALSASKGAPRLQASDPAFIETFETMRRQAVAEFDAADRLRKVDAGAIGRRKTALVAKLKFSTDPAEREQLQKDIAALQAETERLSAQAAQTQTRAETAKLFFAIGDSRIEKAQIKEVSLSAILDWNQPNEQSFFGDLGLFFHRIWVFLSSEPREVNTEGGIFPAIVGTFLMTVLMSLAVVPFGVVTALYLREYAVQGSLVRAVRICVNNLAGVPSIVFGVFGLGFFVYIVGDSVDKLLFPNAGEAVFKTGGILWSALTLALMTVPVVIVATEESVASVPRGMREGSLAMGASKWQTIQRVVLPASVPGIITGAILAMARGAGEVAPLMLVGVVKMANDLPISGEWLEHDIIPGVHLNSKFMHLGFHIFDLGFQSPDSDAVKPLVFATTMVLILIVLILNLGAIMLRNNIRKRYQGSTF